MTPVHRILTALQRGELGRARALLRLRLREAPRDARAWWLKGRLERASGDRARAREALATALRLEPSLNVATVDLAMLQAADGDGRTAAALAQQVLDRVPGHGQALHCLGLGRRLLGDPSGAAEALGRAAVALPQSPVIQANLASCLESTNRNQAAEKAARRALALDPDSALAGFVLGKLLLARGAHDEAEAALDRVLQSGPALPPDLRGGALVTRGKLRDRRGQAGDAFTDISEGQAVLASAPGSAAIDRSHFPGLLARIDEWLGSRAPAPPPAPLGGWTPAFFVGFPRSGTTLALQLLSSHPRVVAVDEQELLADAARELAAMRPGGRGYPAGIDHLTDVQRARLAESYRSKVRERIGVVPDGHVVVDKMPLNLPHLPLALALFPEAPVILALRDPRDCVLSAFMQTFPPSVSMVHFDTLQGTAQTYRAVMKLWEPIAAQPGLRACTLRYEDLVENVQGAITPVLQHLGLDWDPAVLRWRERARGAHINTPSHQDVQQPIFRRARGRWRRYEDQLAPVLPVLAPFVEAFGYASP